MLVRGPRFSFADWLLTTAVIDVDSTRRAKAESFPDAAPTCRRTRQRTGDRRLHVSRRSTSRPAASPCAPAFKPASVPHRRRPVIRLGKPARIKRKRNSRARWRSRCSTICGRAAPGLRRFAQRRGRFVGRRRAGSPDGATRLPRAWAACDSPKSCRAFPTLRHRSDPGRRMGELRRRAESSASCGNLLTCVYQSTRNSGADDRRSRGKIGQRRDRRRVPRMERRRDGRRLRRHRLERRSAASSAWETRRRRAAEHPGPRPRARASGCWRICATRCC